MTKEQEREVWSKVIEVMKELTYLYDKDDKLYFNRDKRLEGYKKLLKIYNNGVNGANMTLTAFKKKLENMRTAYRREMKKVIASKQLGAEAENIYVPTLWYFPLFHFLEGITECYAGVDTFDEALDSWESPERCYLDVEDSHSENETPEELENPTPKRQKLTLQKKQEPVPSAVEILTNQKDEDWIIIGKAIGLQIRDMNKQQQTIVQKIISDAIFYGKMGKLTEESHITLTSQYPAQYVIANLPQSIQTLPQTSLPSFSMSNPLPDSCPIQTVKISPPSSPEYKQSPEPSPQHTKSPEFSPQHIKARLSSQHVVSIQPSQYVQTSQPSPQYVQSPQSSTPDNLQSPKI